jgi:hypothetical protein
MIRFAEEDNVLCPLCFGGDPTEPLREFDLILLTGDGALCNSHNDEVDEMLDEDPMDEDPSSMLDLLLDEDPRDDNRSSPDDLHRPSDEWDVA